MQFGPWSNFRLERIGSGTLAARGREVVSLLRKRGVASPPENRLERAIRLTEQTNDGNVLIRADDPQTAARVLEAFRTLVEAFTVVWTLVERVRGVNPFPSERLAYLLQGADLPTEDANPKARNTQFELLVGATLVMGDADILPEEPDYRLLYHGEYVGVAVKRLTSTKPNTLWGHLRDASHQIVAHGGKGFVAIGLDSWVSDLDAEDVEEVGRKFNEQLQEAHAQLQKASERQALLGALIFANWSRWAFDGAKPTIDWRAPTQLIAFTDTAQELGRVKDFYEPLRARYEASMAEMGKLLRPSQP